jgi:hypothetical protein
VPTVMESPLSLAVVVSGKVRCVASPLSQCDKLSASVHRRAGDFHPFSLTLACEPWLLLRETTWSYD